MRGLEASASWLRWSRYWLAVRISVWIHQRCLNSLLLSHRQYSLFSHRTIRAHYDMRCLLLEKMLQWFLFSSWFQLTPRFPWKDSFSRRAQWGKTLSYSRFPRGCAQPIQAVEWSEWCLSKLCLQLVNHGRSQAPEYSLSPSQSLGQI
jgi:hypothetical protein